MLAFTDAALARLAIAATRVDPRQRRPATFGVTGRTKFNEINDSCNFFCG
jgi:hypothetical protein